MAAMDRAVEIHSVTVMPLEEERGWNLSAPWHVAATM